MTRRISKILLASIMFGLSSAVLGASHSHGMSTQMTGARDDQVRALQADVDSLKAQVAELRQALKKLMAIRPTFASFMPELAERFHVMPRAGHAGDWAVARHELAEMQRLVTMFKAIDADMGVLMDGFLKANFHELQKAIEHAKPEAFDAGLRRTVDNCNGCHTAVGSGFIEVTLDVDESLGMRHPHDLKKSEAAHDHSH